MGFYINDDEVELKQHLNLSDNAWLTVYDDIHNFYPDNTNQPFAGFLNRIFYNFYQSADASIYQRCIERKEHLKKLFSPDAIGEDSLTSEKYISTILKVYEDSLKNRVKSYKKGEGKKFRINKSNLEILKQSADSKYYDNTIGAYLKAIFEEYATLPPFKREQIFFRESLDKINLAIANERKLKIKLLQRTGENNITYSRSFYVTPYAIKQDKTNTFNYLVGFSEEISDDKNKKQKVVASFRLSRIDKIDVMISMGGYISKAEKAQLENEIIKKTPQFIVGEIADIEVKFTSKGLENFNRQLYMRPQNYDIKDEKDKFTYIFHCTEMQAISYFVKFGKDAIILSPQPLKEKFIAIYSTALEGYNTKL
jgi:hypothetical protein